MEKKWKSISRLDPLEKLNFGAGFMHYFADFQVTDDHRLGAAAIDAFFTISISLARFWNHVLHLLWLYKKRKTQMEKYYIAELY